MTGDDSPNGGISAYIQPVHQHNVTIEVPDSFRKDLVDVNAPLFVSVCHWLGKHGKHARPKLSDQQKKELMECFSLMDNDGSGSIDGEELGAAFRLLGIRMSQSEIQRLLVEVDEDGEPGDLDYSEFLQIMTVTLHKMAEDKDSRNDGQLPFDLMATAYRRKRLMEGIIEGDADMQRQIRQMVEKNEAEAKKASLRSGRDESSDKASATSRTKDQRDDGGDSDNNDDDDDDDVACLHVTPATAAAAAAAAALAANDQEAAAHISLRLKAALNEVQVDPQMARQLSPAERQVVLLCARKLQQEEMRHRPASLVMGQMTHQPPRESGQMSRSKIHSPHSPLPYQHAASPWLSPPSPSPSPHPHAGYSSSYCVTSGVAVSNGRRSPGPTGRNSNAAVYPSCPSPTAAYTCTHVSSPVTGKSSPSMNPPRSTTPSHRLSSVQELPPASSSLALSPHPSHGQTLIVYGQNRSSINQNDGAYASSCTLPPPISPGRAVQLVGGRSSPLSHCGWGRHYSMSPTHRQLLESPATFGLRFYGSEGPPAMLPPPLKYQSHRKQAQAGTPQPAQLQQQKRQHDLRQQPEMGISLQQQHQQDPAQHTQQQHQQPEQLPDQHHNQIDDDALQLGEQLDVDQLMATPIPNDSNLDTSIDAADAEVCALLGVSNASPSVDMQLHQSTPSPGSTSPQPTWPSDSTVLATGTFGHASSYPTCPGPATANHNPSQPEAKPSAAAASPPSRLRPAPMQEGGRIQQLTHRTQSPSSGNLLMISSRDVKLQPLQPSAAAVQSGQAAVPLLSGAPQLLQPLQPLQPHALPPHMAAGLRPILGGGMAGGAIGGGWGVGGPVTKMGSPLTLSAFR